MTTREFQSALSDLLCYAGWGGNLDKPRLAPEEEPSKLTYPRPGRSTLR